VAGAINIHLNGTATILLGWGSATLALRGIDGQSGVYIMKGS